MTNLGRLQELIWGVCPVQTVVCLIWKGDRAEVIIISLQLQETPIIKFEIIYVLYYTKTHLYKSNYQLISFIIARGCHEKHITRLDIIVSKWDRIVHFVWVIMSGRFCPWAILSGSHLKHEVYFVGRVLRFNAILTNKEDCVKYGTWCATVSDLHEKMVISFSLVNLMNAYSNDVFHTAAAIV